MLRYLLCSVLLLAWALPLTAVPAQAATPVITLSPDSGPAGTSVKITGTGFPKKTSGTVTAATASAPFKTSASGYFTAELVMPESTEATVAIKATAAAASASAPFTVTYSSPSATEEEPAPAPAPSPAPTTEPAPTAPPAATLRFGVGTPGGPLAAAELDEVAALAGEAPSIILSYKDFRQAPPLAELDAARARGALTLLTWEPWAWGGGTDQPAYALDRITAGDFDPYLQQWGQALAGWGHPVMLRFGHEMNGNWYPWSEQVNGNSAGDYVAAWRHVHSVVSAAGATNVNWVWNPNVPYWESIPFTGLYPGAAYVDTVALDGYNWGTSAFWSSWQTPSQLFGDGLSQLRALAPGKQILIAETSSAEQGGSKADWNTALISYLSSQPDITAVTWFHFNKETDWRINSSTASADAFKQALAARR
ncbi:beta-mannanase [Pseudarthrobacter sp. NamE5]|nr:glycosyl hydrolase [Pseudarthrobacter sp. NamE5]TLM85936.1 beta-mannanase [Pseudarthrobacter sp. NamE5]